MHAVWSPAYEVDIGPHVFPTAKYRLVRGRLLDEGVLDEQEILTPRPADRRAVARIHTAGYLRKIREDDFSLRERRMLEVPFSPELHDAMELCCGGTILVGETALAEAVCVHLGGGFHHAFPDHGEGFCLFNDVAVATADLRARGRVQRIAVVDLDVHHGNGTAAVFADEPSVFTFSMHQERNYPTVKPAGDLDLGLENGVDDERYLELLAEHLPLVLDDHAPDLVFYLAGADPYRRDQLGGLGLSLEGLRRRDLLVLGECVSRGIPVAVTLAGGYAFRREDTVEIHCNTVRAAREAWTAAGRDT